MKTGSWIWPPDNQKTVMPASWALNISLHIWSKQSDNFQPGAWCNYIVFRIEVLRVRPISIGIVRWGQTVQTALFTWRFAEGRNCSYQSCALLLKGACFIDNVTTDYWLASFLAQKYWIVFLFSNSRIYCILIVYYIRGDRSCYYFNKRWTVKTGK